MKYYIKNGRKFLRNPQDALEIGKRADSKRKTYAINSTIDNERAAETARRIGKVDTDSLNARAAKMRTIHSARSGKAVLCADRVEITAAPLTVDEKRAAVKSWIESEKLDSNLLAFAAAAVNSRTRKMLRYGRDIYYRNRTDMNNIKTRYNTTAERPRRGDFWTLEEAAAEMDATRRRRLEIVRLEKELTAARTDNMVRVIDTIVSDGHTSVVEDAIQETAAYILTVERAAAEMDATIDRGALWADCQRKIDQFLRYDGRYEMGKDATETLTAEIERGRKAQYKSQQYRYRVEMDAAERAMYESARNSAVNDIVGYEIASIIDIRAALTALENYTAAQGKTAAAVLNMLLSGQSVNDTAAALNVNRKTVSRHKARLISIALEYINADIKTAAPLTPHRVKRITADLPRRGGQVYYGGHFAPIETRTARRVKRAPRLMKDTVKIHADFIAPTMTETAAAAHYFSFTAPRYVAPPTPPRKVKRLFSLSESIERANRRALANKSAAESAAVFTERAALEEYVNLLVHNHFNGVTLDTAARDRIDTAHRAPRKMDRVERVDYSRALCELWPPIVPPRK